MMGAPFPGGSAAVPTYLDQKSSASSVGGGVPTVFSGLNFGTNSGGYMVVGVTANIAGGASPSAVIIGGVAATMLCSAGAGIREASLWIALVPAGSVTSVSITYGSTYSYFAIALYSVSGIRSLVPFDSATSTAAAPSATKNIPRNGCAIAVVIAETNSGQPISASWTGLTIDTDTIPAAGIERSSASIAVEVAQSALLMKCTFSTSFGSAGAFAIFSP